MESAGLTRRDAVRDLGLGFLFILFGGLRKLAGRPSQPKARLDFEMPAGACDCHNHVFGDPARFPFAAGRVYTPPTASVEELQALHRALRIERTVIVQPSVYGTDNACTLDAVSRLGPSARGVAVIDDATPDALLDEMQEIGIRGVRINLATGGQKDPEVARRRFRAAIDRVAPRRWHIQIYTQLPVIAALREDVLQSPVPVVFDHFGGAQADAGPNQPGLDALLHLVRSGSAYVKLSAPYRCSIQAPDYPDVAPIARALVAANPGRMLWASDWPHPDSTPPAGRSPTDITPLYKVDDAHILNLFARWVPDAATRKAILVDNPARLYGFNERK